MSNKELALKYLEVFYSEKYYSRYTIGAPIQLTPTFTNMVNNDRYLEAIWEWREWQEQTVTLLSDATKTAPIMMLNTSEQGMKFHFYLSLEKTTLLLPPYLERSWIQKPPTLPNKLRQRQSSGLIR